MQGLPESLNRVGGVCPVEVVATEPGVSSHSSAMLSVPLLCAGTILLHLGVGACVYGTHFMENIVLYLKFKVNGQSYICYVG